MTMTAEETIKYSLVEKFSYLESSLIIQRARRIFAEVDSAHFFEVFDYAVKELKFSQLCTITGLDEQDKLSFIYHLAQDSGILFNLKISVPREKPVLKTISAYFPTAEIYEREVIDLLGAQVEGLPVGNRYPLPDNWPQGEYPLRKDWKSTPADKWEGDSNV